MTTLAFRTDPYTLGDASENIGETLSAVALELARLGFIGVSNEGHVSGSKAGCGVDLFYLFNGHRSFWQVIMGCGPDQPTIERTLDEVKRVVSALHLP